ncbi:MAG: DUF664 domain-containing protein [Pseudonocardia sp.]|nr:DUF664 domain-containing protein [Pseudonocardia sp.]MBO0878440.1 DUF664 domain-containing protein [Pseudonocardia sp.]
MARARTYISQRPRFLFHLAQGYARHVGRPDIVREPVDGRPGE